MLGTTTRPGASHQADELRLVCAKMIEATGRLAAFLKQHPTTCRCPLCKWDRAVAHQPANILPMLRSLAVGNTVMLASVEGLRDAIGSPSETQERKELHRLAGIEPDPAA